MKSLKRSVAKVDSAFYSFELNNINSKSFVKRNLEAVFFINTFSIY